MKHKFCLILLYFITIYFCSYGQEYKIGQKVYYISGASKIEQTKITAISTDSEGEYLYKLEGVITFDLTGYTKSDGIFWASLKDLGEYINKVTFAKNQELTNSNDSLRIAVNILKTNNESLLQVQQKLLTYYDNIQNQKEENENSSLSYGIQLINKKVLENLDKYREVGEELNDLLKNYKDFLLILFLINLKLLFHSEKKSILLFLYF